MIFVWLETPLAPSTPVVSDIQTTSVRLSWFPPGYNGNSPITSYNVYAKKGSNNWNLQKDDINPSDRQMSVTLRNLSPHTQYQFHVRAVNSVGEGTPSGASGVIRTLIAGNYNYNSSLGLLSKGCHMSGNGQGKKFLKVSEKSGNFSDNLKNSQGKLKQFNRLADLIL